MTTDRDVTRIVRSWLEEGVTSIPDRVLDSVLDQLPANPQRRAWWPAWRLSELNTTIRFAVAIAAVAVVAVVGINVLPRSGSGVGGPAPVTSPAPVASPDNPSPSASPSPAPSARDLSSFDVGKALDAGTYRVGAPFAVPFTIAFPVGFTPGSSKEGDVTFGGFADANLGVTVDLVEGVFNDPCHPGTGPTTSPSPLTVDGLMPTLTHMVGFQAGPVSDVVVGGHAGKSFRLTNTVDTATAGCTRGPMLPLWTFRGDPSGAATNGKISLDIWVVDVGGTPVVIAVDGDAAALTADRTKVQSIVDSIRFEP